MTTQPIACSVSRQVSEWLENGQTVVQVLSTFPHACNLITSSGDMISVVSPRVGDGPLNIVLDSTNHLATWQHANLAVTSTSNRLRVNGLEVDLGRARQWEPRPDWPALRSRRSAILFSLPLLQAHCLRHSPTSAFAPLLEGQPSSSLAQIVLARARDAVEDLQNGWRGDQRRLERGAAALAGMGSGLTPAGDDFLCGLMLWAWLAHPKPDRFCQDLARAVLPRTHTLSAAFLRAAMRGQCSAPWHALLTGLEERREASAMSAAQEILGHGATSGGDALIGFLCFSSGPQALGRPRRHHGS